MLFLLFNIYFLTTFCSKLCITEAYHKNNREHKKFRGRLLSSTTAASKEKQPWCSISDAYDGGNIEYVWSNATTPYATVIYLRIKSDPYTPLEDKRHKQYFSFRCICEAPQNTTQLIFEILNAKDCSFPKAWLGTTVFVSNSLLSGWTRVSSTRYNSTTGHLIWSYNLPQSSTAGGSAILFFSYFPPYTYERHLQLISACATASKPLARVMSLGKTLEGRDIDLVSVGYGPRVAWIIHRQHPGETMAEYFAEGFLHRLLSLKFHKIPDEKDDEDVDVVKRTALEMFTFYIIPNMCPDGAVHGYLRTNANGSNLNREWAPTGKYQAPTLERSPEVFYVLQEMDKTGVDVFADVHGDETIPLNFIVGNEGLWDERLQALHGAFVGAYTRANSDMQKMVSYKPASTSTKHKNGKNKGKNNINLAIASRQIAHRFQCLSVTLEMPFKDCLSNPDPIYGWSPDRARKLGASLLEALVYVQPYLRMEGVTAKTFPSKEDTYVLPTDRYEDYFPMNTISGTRWKYNMESNKTSDGTRNRS
jgi:murein tripeptide amidase MpaA